MTVDQSNVRLPNNVTEYHFFQLVELLQQLLGQDPEDADGDLNSRLIFSSDPSLGFASSDVSVLSELNDGRLKLEASFLGLNGAHSPLPGFMLEQIANEGEQGLRRHFLDFFNHRLLSLLYSIWRKYRYYLRFRADAQDGFSAQLFALVGLADENLRGETPINWCKMLSYAGMLAGRSRSPQVVSGIIAHCFDLQDVSIRQWELRQVPIPASQQLCLGKANACLGEDTVIGSQVADRMGKFVICLRGLSLTRFGDFLPTGREHQPLLTLVQFILREQMAFDLELELNPDEAKPMQLNSSQPVSLGWSSFTGESQHNRCVRIQIRQ
ncbi:hypothetical protein NFHSH190041_19010 [Shewanella sp. NFH-SH190041]|uniref:type VI secretion system baseplate subunit TssG n=1 Tax=Shewanella sp. NFH-SH190041 TaxID=2950245 RepID=UPI0021C3999B|nr:type VI secretion system baseplate subunit TssG [Shewanella sp. NFH-SH190041]BDM64449.1 hypothetical protein NFHSH190041_19010 [Shewanella sp. NFH-SH190041]